MASGNYDERIIKVCEGIAALVQPVRIILFHSRFHLSGELEGFKLCVIVNQTDCYKIEQKIYLNVECDVSYDVLVYNRDLWDSLMSDPCSFASRGIQNGGVVLYESE
ncbi:MAG: hypothetical protein IIU00_01645 [Clostridia bacterium]|nr:hypothetical protein [Clostridia bacterium]